MCLTIWEDELGDLSKVIKKVKKFTNSTVRIKEAI